MSPDESKAKPASLGWTVAITGAALALAAVMAAVWWQESHRPWQAEVAAINAERGRRLQAALLAAGADPALAARRGAELAAEPPRVIAVRPRAFNRTERCLTCHRGIAEISPSHRVEAVGCVVCHGGQGLGLTKAQAHRGLLGRNPAAPATARVSCGGGAGRCHAGRPNPAANTVYRVQRTIMATMTGVLTSLRAAWGAQSDWRARFGAAAVSDPRRPTPAPPNTLAGLSLLPATPAGRGFAGLADDHWSKFCARCHLNAQRPAGPSAHGQGCVACHGSRDPSGRYLGADAAIPNQEPGHAARHRLVLTPPEDNCRRCHNRSGRIGLNYRGWMEDEAGRAPWHGGQPNRQLSGGRGVRRLLPDVHAQKGLGCIDCHSGREIMGDGRIYGRMRHQTEVRCATCHGSRQGPPRLGPPDLFARFEAAYGPLGQAGRLGPNPRLVLSAKGRPLGNLRLRRGRLVLLSRSRPGQVHPVPQVADDPAHNLPGHRRLACQACHSRWAPQCYGCHDYRKPGAALWDYRTGRPTPGAWQETRDLYRFRQPMLGVNSRGRIGPLVPGCQVMLTEMGRPGGGKQILRRGPTGGSIVSTPIAPHTTRRRVPTCEHCHMNPRVLGLGPGPVRLGALTAEPLADLSPVGWPVDWETLVDAEGRTLMATTHAGARPLDRQELARVLGWARCLPCHRRPDDPVVRDPAKARARIGPGGDHRAKHKRQVEKALR